MIEGTTGVDKYPRMCGKQQSAALYGAGPRHFLSSPLHFYRRLRFAVGEIGPLSDNHRRVGFIFF